MEKIICKTYERGLEKPKPMKNSYIPLPIIQVILSNLPFIYLPTCRLVSKHWNDMVLSSSSSFSSSTIKFVPNSASVFVSVCDEFGKNLPSNSGRVCLNYIDINAKHSNGIDSFASFKFDQDWPYKYNTIVNSCKGLLCMIHELNSDCSCIILNPMTNEHMKLPIDVKPSYWDSYSYGLGFSLTTKQYKIVRFGFCDSDDTNSFGYTDEEYDRVCRTMTLEILTLGNKGQWRSFDSRPLFICKKFHGVYLNGALYWIGRDDMDQEKVIYRFDVEDEKFEKVSFPVNSINDYAVCINVFNGSLCVNIYNRRDEPLEIQVWSMIMHNDGGKESWIKEFVFKDIFSLWWIDSSNFQLVKVYYEDGEMLYLIQSWDLFLYNPKAKTCKIKRKNGSLSHGIYEIDSPNFDSLEKMMAGDRQCDYELGDL